MDSRRARYGAVVDREPDVPEEPFDPERLAREGWVGFAPLPAGDVAACSFCGEPQEPARRVLMNADGSAGLCEHCCSTHAAFFARLEGREPR